MTKIWNNILLVIAYVSCAIGMITLVIILIISAIGLVLSLFDSIKD